MITKLGIIIGGVVLLASAALGGTLTSLGSTNNPQIGSIPPPAASVNVRQEDRARENELRGRENEVRGRANEAGGRENEAGEDLRGPCDEAEHANDPRCTGVATVGDDDRSGPSDHSGRDDSGHDDSGRSGHGGGDDD
jgi:hypothetical protein